ncbi:MAG: hypothetical protein EAZ44_07615 [Cytophagia bacterium]|nr:MAG: hypothetical protein EAZ44_07615 [Cytophagia bacterium]
MNTQLSLFAVDAYISKKKPIPYAQNKEQNLSVVNDIAPNYHLYPSEDDEPMAQDSRQANIMVNLKNALNYIFDNKKDIFVGIDLFLYLTRNKVKAPDIMVARGVKEEEHRKSYIIDKEGKAPDVVMEVLSSSNYADKNDLKNRLNFYAECKIKEFYVIHTQPCLSIDIYFLVNDSYYNKILDFDNFYDNYLECSIYVKNGEIVVEDKNNEIIEGFTAQVKAKKEAEKAKKEAQEKAELEAKARQEAEKAQKEAEKAQKEAEKQAKLEAKARQEAEEEKRQMWLQLEELHNLLKKQTKI